MFVRLLKLPEAIRKRYDLSSLRFIAHGAAPCPPDMKRAMIDVEGWLQAQGETAPARLIMQVHDELVLEVRADAVEEVREGVRQHMCAAAALRVPLKVEVGVGLNWDEAH